MALVGLKSAGLLKASVAVLAAGGLAAATALAATGSGASARHRSGFLTAVAPQAPQSVTTTTPPTTAPPSTTTSTSTTTTVPPAPQRVTLAGCPVPTRPPGPPGPPPWHPATLVPDSALPPVQAPTPWRSSLAAIDGKGMWIWLWSSTDGGNAAAVVAQAKRAGLSQLWVRAGDSKNGFYGASELGALVPVAHASGIRVVAWGFPYLYDPVGDATWTGQVLAWRSQTADSVDA